MKNLRPFEIVLIGFFAVCAIGALIFVSVFQQKNVEQENPYGNSVVIWGTFDISVINPRISDVARNTKGFGVVSYEQKDARSFENELLSHYWNK